MRRGTLILCAAPVICSSACTSTSETAPPSGVSGSSSGSGHTSGAAPTTSGAQGLSHLETGDKLSAAEMSRIMSNAARQAGTVVATISAVSTAASSSSSSTINFKESVDCKAKTAVVTRNGQLSSVERDGKFWAASTSTRSDYVKTWCEGVDTGDERVVVAADDATVALSVDSTVPNQHTHHAVDRLERSTGRLLDAKTTYTWRKASVQTHATTTARYGDPVTGPTIPSSWKSVALH